MIVQYFRLNTPDLETSGTPDAIAATLRLYLDEGGTDYWVTGPFDNPPRWMRPGRRPRPPLAECQRAEAALAAAAGGGGPAAAAEVFWHGRHDRDHPRPQPDDDEPGGTW